MTDLLDLVGSRVRIAIDGRIVRGRLISCRDDFLTIEQRPGRRIYLNAFELSSIERDLFKK